MKTKFSGDTKVIDVLNPLGVSVGTIRRALDSKGYVYFARAGFFENEVWFRTEKAARTYLLDNDENSSLDLMFSTEDFHRAMI